MSEPVLELQRLRERFTNRLAAVLLVYLATLGIFAIYWGYNNNQYDRDEAIRQTKGYISHVLDPGRRVCLDKAPDVQAECFINLSRTTREAARQEQDLVAQRVTAIWTFIIGAATILSLLSSAFGVFLVWKTFSASKEANQIARQQLEIDSRPWMIIDDVQIHRRISGISPTTPIAQIRCRNIGKLPALRVHAHVELVLLTEAEFGEFVAGRLKLPLEKVSDDTIERTVLPGESYVSYARIEAHNTDEIRRSFDRLAVVFVTYGYSRSALVHMTRRIFTLNITPVTDDLDDSASHFTFELGSIHIGAHAT
ncbi:MAG: hypothetical protein LCH46_07235 [Proteobacteria bacterium]|nr:hypothetical protein [Pseudomonadota bacterium]